MDDVFGSDVLAGPQDLIVSASKNGTVYALDPNNGDIVWSNPVQPLPVSPGFAGFGLFNGALAFAEGRLHAALYELIPAIPTDHLQAFDAGDGSVLWTDEIGISWAHVSVANGVLFTGTNDEAAIYVYNAATGKRLDVLPLPDTTSSGPSIVSGEIYVGYGIFSSIGGVRAYELAD